MATGFLFFYVLLLLVLGLIARWRAKPGHEDFFLAGRRLGPLVLLVTMAATNFSSFTVFGFAGAGYRFGYSYYPIMAFGTGFMVLTFLLIGIPAYRSAKQTRAITPPELLYYRFQNRALHIAYLTVMVIFTLPYLALQPIGAGYMLQAVLGLPYQLGAALVVFIGLGYVLLSGLRGDAWTDILQGLVMLLGMAAIFGGILWAIGGLNRANQRLIEQLPALFSRPGAGGVFTPKIWLSYFLLWFFCDPMFPQLFQRFLAAKDEQTLKTTATVYPLLTGLLFFFPVALGVTGHLILPGLEGNRTDQILPLLVAKLLSPPFAGLMTIVGLAALMSTMDSQLLTLSSIIIRDIRLLLGKKPEPRFPLQVPVVTLLALAGLFLALKPWGTILDIATETFTGLAVLFPVTIAGAYWKRANPWAGFASIIAGESLVIAYHFKWLPDFGFLPVIPIMAVTGLVLILGSLIFPARGLTPWAKIDRKNWRWVLLFTMIFVLALDFYNWHRHLPLILGLPLWLWFHFGLLLLLFLALLLYQRLGKRKQPPATDVQSCQPSPPNL